MNRKEYFAITKQWEERYGVKSRAFTYNPVEVKLCCVKCGAHGLGGMSRHHKANDFFFAFWRPDLYAARYLTFDKDDVAKLCQRCHKKVENFYTRLKVELYEDFERFDKIVDKKWCEEWRARFVDKYNEWLAKPIRKSSHLSPKRHKNASSNKRPRRNRSY